MIMHNKTTVIQLARLCKMNRLEPTRARVGTEWERRNPTATGVFPLFPLFPLKISTLYYRHTPNKQQSGGVLARIGKNRFKWERGNKTRKHYSVRGFAVPTGWEQKHNQKRENTTVTGVRR